jgi:hypothetical protein
LRDEDGDDINWYELGKKPAADEAREEYDFTPELLRVSRLPAGSLCWKVIAASCR